MIMLLFCLTAMLRLKTQRLLSFCDCDPFSGFR